MKGGRHLFVVTDSRDGVPVGYASWAEWRAGRGEAERWPIGPAGRQCPLCWGQRRIWEPGPLGLLPIICEDCAGTGLWH